MKKAIILLLAAACYCLPAHADDHPEYAAKNIPANLLPHANAVVRTQTTEIKVISLQEVDIKEHVVITVLNELGNKYADEGVEISDLNTLVSVSGCIYDANGEKVTKIKAGDFKEYPVTLEAAYVTSAKEKAYMVSYRNYPYTVEYTMEAKQNHTFALPYWMPAADRHCAVEAASLSVYVKGKTDIQYKEYNYPGLTAHIVATDSDKKYSWSMNNIHAFRSEPMSYKGNFEVPVISLETNNYMLDNFEGTSDSWRSFGAFVYKLNSGRDVLLPDIAAKAKQLVAGARDDHEKVRILYSYLQGTMRYVLVDYGIGGWQTMDAQFLSKNQYGDCKALSNYMMALLAAVNIKSYAVLIHGEQNSQWQIERDFVSSQFNHCILCVPFANDTTWLECTSNDLAAGYLSDFTGDRDALMITPMGGVLVHTPIYDTSVNVVTHHALIHCNDNGSLRISMSSLYSGEPADHVYETLRNINDHDKNEYLNTKFALPSYTLDDYKYNRINTSPITHMSEDAVLTASGMFTKTGSRSFLQFDVAPLHVTIPDQEEGERKTSFFIGSSSATCDTFEMPLPDKADVEYIPSPVAMRYPFGSYSCTIEQKEGKLVLVSKFTLVKGVYEPKLFADYTKMVATATGKANKKVVFKNKA
jgi:hypothetical protein